MNGTPGQNSGQLPKYGAGWRTLRTKEVQGTVQCSAKGGLLPCQDHRIVRCR